MKSRRRRWTVKEYLLKSSSNAWIPASLACAGVGLIDAAESIAAMAKINGTMRSIEVPLRLNSDVSHSSTYSLVWTGPFFLA